MTPTPPAARQPRTAVDFLRRISAMAERVWSSEDADELRRTIRKIEGIARSAINGSRSIEGPHPESAEWQAGYRAGRDEVVHDHDPDKCDECQEMVMEALRD